MKVELNRKQKLTKRILFDEMKAQLAVIDRLSSELEAAKHRIGVLETVVIVCKATTEDAERNGLLPF